MSSLLIIDEPDVYLHPDLQRRLIRDIRERQPQYVVATHAAEIINDADAAEILTVHPAAKKAKRIRTEGEYQSVYRYIGSGENAVFARLAKAKKAIFVKGDDEKIIRKFARHSGYDALCDPQKAPIFKLGGFSEWRKAKDAAWAVRNILEIDIDIRCVFDRDCRGDAEVEDFLNERAREEIYCYIHDRKEIENYLLVPTAIHRAVVTRLRSKSSVSVPTLADIERIMWSITDEQQIDLRSALMASYRRYEKKKTPGIDDSTIDKKFLKKFADDWQNIDFRFSSIGGKRLISTMNERLQDIYKINVTEFAIIDQLSRDSVDGRFLAMLDDLNAFCSD